MAMDGFVSAFHQVDVDDDGIINEDDLNSYCERNNLKRNFTDKWLGLFDHDNDKIIHYEEFCRVLGIESKRRYSNASGSYDDTVVYQETDMSNATKDAVIKKIYKKGKHAYNLKEDTIKDLIDELNMDHGPNWNIIVNPTPKEVKCAYDFDGKLYYTPNSKEKNKLLVWRKDDTKKRGFACCC